MDLKGAYEEASAAMAHNLNAIEDAQEGLLAFAEKRAPRWRS